MNQIGRTTAAVVADILEREAQLARRVKEARRSADARLAAIEDEIAGIIAAAAAEGERQVAFSG